MSQADPTLRFSTRVADYVRYRPGYPAAVLTVLREHAVLRDECFVADVGSGTGILTEMLLRDGHAVFAVEPNAPMRAAAERRLAGLPRFHSVAARAEETTLPPASMHVVTAAQAFHWFDRPAARREFARVLRPGGWVVVLWNERLTDTTPFLRGYEALLQRRAADYGRVDHRRIDGAMLRSFFGPAGYAEAAFPNRQEFDRDGVRGRLLSSSYAPHEGDPNHAPMLRELDELFGTHQSGGRVAFEYVTRMQFGRLT